MRLFGSSFSWNCHESRQCARQMSTSGRHNVTRQNQKASTQVGTLHGSGFTGDQDKHDDDKGETATDADELDCCLNDLHNFGLVV